MAGRGERLRITGSAEADRARGPGDAGSGGQRALPTWQTTLRIHAPRDQASSSISRQLPTPADRTGLRNTRRSTRVRSPHARAAWCARDWCNLCVDTRARHNRLVARAP
eukprot:6585626-Prymnesium_polylepis.1